MNSAMQIQRSTGHAAARARLLLSAFCVLLSILGVPHFALSARPGVNVTATLEPAEIRPGAFTTFVITIENGVPDSVPQLKLPPGLELTTSEPAVQQQTTITNGMMKQACTITWQINSTEKGDYIIPAQEFTVRGQKFATTDVKLVVKDNPAFPVSKFDPLMNLEVAKREFYLGEVVPVTVSLYVHRKTYLRRVGLIELPKESFAVQRFPLQGDETSVTMGGVPYRLLTYHSTLSGLKPGKFKLGPASSEIILEVPSDDQRLLNPFFSQTEPRKVRPQCNDIEVTVLPLPTEGVPKGFSNLVGDFEVSMTAEPHEVSVNDPISVEMTITGTGNFDAVTVPAITDPDSWKVYPARRYNVQSGDNAADGTSRSIGFSQVIIPKKQVDSVPPFELSYFSPQKKQYVTLRTNAVPLSVKPAAHSVEPPPVTAVESAPGNQTAIEPEDKVPQVKPNITDILAVVQNKPRWLAVRPAPWADQRFRNANLIAAGVVLFLVVLKLGAVVWRARASSPLTPTRKLWNELHDSRLSQSRFYSLVTNYIAVRGLAGDDVQAILDRNNVVNYGRPSEEAEAPVPREERERVLATLQAHGT